MPTLQERMLIAIPEEMARRVFADKTSTITLVATERQWRVLYASVETVAFMADHERDLLFLLAAKDLIVKIRMMLMIATPPIVPGDDMIPDRIITVTGNRVDLFNAISAIGRVVAEIQDENPDAIAVFEDDSEALPIIRATWTTFRKQLRTIEPEFGKGIE